MPTDVVKDLIDVQTKHLQVKAEELALKKQQDDHAFDFGKQSLEAQERDRNQERIHTRKVVKGVLILLALLVSAVVAIILCAMFLGKDQVAMEVIKAIVYIGCGGAGGYGVARSRTSGDAKG